MKLRGRITVFTIIILLVNNGESVFSADYAFIKSKDLQQINRVISGFRESYPDSDMAILDLKGKQAMWKIKRFIKKEQPILIVCLGSLAARLTARVEKNIPIVFCLVINYKRYDELKQENISGISMEIPPQTLFTQFRLLMPHVKSIGVPFHPSVSSEIVEDAVNASRKMGMQITKIQVTDPNEIREKLAEKENRYAGLWMMADTRLYNRKTTAINELIDFSKARKKPLLAFSEAFLKSGAFFSISIDYRSLGSQMALFARQVAQDGIPPSNIPVAPPIGTYTVINRDTARLILGDSLDEDLFDEVDKVYSENEEE